MEENQLHFCEEKMILIIYTNAPYCSCSFRSLLLSFLLPGVYSKGLGAPRPASATFSILDAKSLLVGKLAYQSGTLSSILPTMCSALGIFRLSSLSSAEHIQQYSHSTYPFLNSSRLIALRGQFSHFSFC